MSLDHLKKPAVVPEISEYDRFVKLVASLRKCKIPKGHVLQARFEKQAVEAYRQLFPRKKKVPEIHEICSHESIRPILDAFNLRANAIVDKVSAKHDRIESQLYWLAQRVAPVDAGELRLLDAVASSSYSSQGFGAEKYASGDAERKADVIRAMGLSAEVRPVFHKFDGASRWGISGWTDYEVWGSTDLEVGYQIVKRRRFPLRDQVKLMLKRGVNPRVYMPFLEHGYEESVGLDHFGNDVNLPVSVAVEEKLGIL